MMREPRYTRPVAWGTDPEAVEAWTMGLLVRAFRVKTLRRSIKFRPGCALKPDWPRDGVYTYMLSLTDREWANVEGAEPGMKRMPNGKEVR